MKPQFTSLAKNLYTSNARFVFELLQNTEDNQYSVALAGGEEPFASFSIFPDRIVVDCNEDGFTEDNLTAISDIGNSSKSSSQGYIGEKGIGFKSVFMAAWKVHIHSGHLSFSFVHRKGDSGMGMVSPVWEEPTEELPRLNHTRMTLFLHEGQDEDEISRSRDNIQRQFLALEPAFLLFVSKLKRIDVLFHDQHGQQFWARRLSRRRAADVHRVVLEIRLANTDNLDNIDPEAHSYHVTEHMATNVARHENRDLSVSEAASPSSRQSKIVLAFTVSSDSVPVIKPQKVFAFLPMRLMGFNVSWSDSAAATKLLTILTDTSVVPHPSRLRHPSKQRGHRDIVTKEQGPCPRCDRRDDESHSAALQARVSPVHLDEIPAAPRRKQYLGLVLVDPRQRS